jgi:FHS family L-fucose permease-like MFS transporter
MTIVTTIFFMWGLITVLNDVLIPDLKAIFQLDYFESMLIQFCFFGSYFIFSVPFGKVVEKVGYQSTMVIGLAIAGIGALMFIPAAEIASYPLFLGALIVLAAGITALQVSANPYVSILGEPASASSRLNLAQAFNSLGTTIAPKIGGLLILGTAAAASATAIQKAHSVILPYIVLAAVLFILAIGVKLANLPAMLEATEVKEGAEHPTESIWKYKHTILGALAIFLYVGAEVSIGSFLVNYFEQKYIGNLSAVVAAGYVSLYWGCAMIGRFIGSAVLRTVKAGVALGAVASVAGLLVLLSMLSFGHVAMVTIIAVGLFNSIMFPNIFTLGIADLGPLTGEGSGLLIAAIVGGAIIPLAQGKIADAIGIHHAFILPILCYLYLIYYGLKGSIPSAKAPIATTA